MSSYRVFTLYKGGTKVYVAYAHDEDTMHSFAFKHKMEYSSIIAGRQFESRLDAEQEVEKIVQKFHVTHGELPKYNRSVYIGSTNNTAWCYLCGMRESATIRLIEGAHGFVCRSCLDGMIDSMVAESGTGYLQTKVLAANGQEPESGRTHGRTGSGLAIQHPEAMLCAMSRPLRIELAIGLGHPALARGSA